MISVLAAIAVGLSVFILIAGVFAYIVDAVREYFRRRAFTKRTRPIVKRHYIRLYFKEDKNNDKN